MEKKEMIKIARKALMKGWDFETLKYGDDMYGRESLAEYVWDYVTEGREIGTIAFDNKYGDLLKA